MVAADTTHVSAFEPEVDADDDEELPTFGDVDEDDLNEADEEMEEEAVEFDGKFASYV